MNWQQKVEAQIAWLSGGPGDYDVAAQEIAASLQALLDVAVAADDLSNPRDSRPYRDVADALDTALDKLREVGDG